MKQKKRLSIKKTSAFIGEFTHSAFHAFTEIFEKLQMKMDLLLNVVKHPVALQLDQIPLVL